MGIALATGSPPASGTATSGTNVALAEGVKLQSTDKASMMGAFEPVRVNVVLKMHDTDELRQMADLVRTHAHAPLTDSDLAARYLPHGDDAARVVNFLRANGFGNIHVSKDNVIVTAEGTASGVQSAFGTRLYKVTNANGSGIANVDAVQIPASLSGVVGAVLGLRSYSERGLSAAKAATAGKNGPKLTAKVSAKGKKAPGTQAASGDTTVACRECVHAPTDFPQLYNADGLAPALSQSVAIIGVGDQGETPALYQTWANGYGITPIPLAITYPTGYTAGDYEAQTEAVLDIDAVTAMSGGLQQIAFYSAPSTDLSDELTAVTAAVNDNHTTISLSFAASCDSDIPQDLRNSWDQELYAAIAKGLTVFAVTQDDGGYPNCSDNASSTGFPASSPYVVSVGASTLINTADSYSTYDHETLWVDSESGPAATEQRPWYQDVVANVVGSMRGTPDFVMDGDPNTGLWVVTGYVDSSGTFQQQWAVYGGTSLAAPLLAGTYARILQSGIPPYFWPQTFYDIGTAQVKKTKGDCLDCYNFLTGGSNGAYSVVPGQYNQASGWGSWNAASVANAMRYQR
ncbi:hypothetical protein IHE49_11750 [Rhodanobacter sp. 7MK24]|nr:hypothetical protein [Rhodanobacter sp. 7MK24]